MILKLDHGWLQHLECIWKVDYSIWNLFGKQWQFIAKTLGNKFLYHIRRHPSQEHPSWPRRPRPLTTRRRTRREKRLMPQQILWFQDLDRFGWKGLKTGMVLWSCMILYSPFGFLTFPDVPRNLNNHIQIRTQMTTAFGMYLESSGSL